MTARDYAIADIKDELRRKNKCFINFRTSLNPAMRRIERHALRRQSSVSFFAHSRPLCGKKVCRVTPDGELLNYERA